jgi:hypothetical protein
MFRDESRMMLAAFVGSGWYKWGWLDYAVVAVAGAIVVIHLSRLRLKDGQNSGVSKPHDDQQRGWKKRRSRNRKT